ncbi:MAG TPA: alpha/beta hydrolase family protein [Methylomirabilota bacterium]|nr:alpha/beta hydrolase family protein [Methylomirabilota bacterium]
MATFVLVHGAWHGGWCWIRVARLLRDAAHEVHTPTLTGLGDRAHQARPEIDLEAHVQDVVGVLEAEELRNVILVGHSYAGMVITGVAARAANRLSHLVYLDAFVPEAGKALLDYAGPRAEAIRESARAEGEGWRIPPFPPERFGVTSQRDREWLQRRLVPQPLKTFEQPLAAAGGDKAKRVYVYCSSPAMGAFDQFAERLREDRKWQFHDVKTGHDAMITASGEVAKILLALTK